MLYLGNFSHSLPDFPQVWLPASKGKGLEITGTFARKNKQVTMELTFTNKAMQNMTDFAIQLNKNRYVSRINNYKLVLT